MIPVLYLHGFASSPRGRKVEALTRLLTPEGIILNAPDLNVPSFEYLDYEAMVDRAVETGHANPPGAIVGSSLGALVALDVVRRRGLRAPLVLIAPAVGISDRWRENIASGDPIYVFNHALEREAPIHRAFLDQIEHVQPETETPAVRVSIVMGRNDESVPFACVMTVWEKWKASGKLVEGSKLVEIPEGDHGLTAFVDVIADEIRGAVRGGSRLCGLKP